MKKVIGLLILGIGIACAIFLLRAKEEAATTRVVSSPAELRQAIAEMGARGGIIELTGDQWHFGKNDTTDMSIYISNHDHLASRPVNLPIVGCTNLVLRGHGQTLVFDSPTIHAVIKDSQNISITDLRFDTTVPVLADAQIVRFENDGTVLKLDGKLYPHEFIPDEKNKELAQLVIKHPLGAVPVNGAMMFDGKTHEIIEQSGDVPVPQPVKPLGDGCFWVKIDYRGCWNGGPGAKVGDIIAMRPRNRYYPSVVVHRSSDVAFTDFVIHSCMGMGLIAQVSKNVSWVGTRPATEKVSGVFPPKGSARVSTLQADATHFSNVAGMVRVENCLFETMMDDALNVHCTCVPIKEVLDGNKLRCRYAHFQAIGFGVFAPGDTLRFIKASLMKNGPTCKIVDVETLNEWEFIVTLAEKLPDGFGVGDAIENTDYQPSVIFDKNVVRFNRARGILLTTPKPVRVRENLFDRVSGCAILFAGDTSGWYESGACTDVLIEKNIFRNCNTTVYGASRAVITSRPKARRVSDVSYHNNIRIVDNTFETFDVPLLLELSTTNTVWRNNTIITNDLYQARKLPRFIREETAQDP